MKNVMGLIHHYKNEETLREITEQRCMASVPYGGRYRLVDFVLSNMVNAGIGNIGMITSLNLRSLLDHLGNGKDWGLDKKHGGLFILPTAHNNKNNSRRIDLEDFFVNLDYFQRSKQKYVMIAGSNIVCKIDYKKVLSFHQDKKADVTTIYKENYPFAGEKRRAVFPEVGEAGTITAWQPRLGQKRKSKICLDMYIMEKSLLLKLLEEAAGRRKWDLIALMADHFKDLKIYGYAHQGYVAIVDSIPSYYRHHFDLLMPETWHELFFNNGPVYTKFKDGPPTKYYDGSDVRNTLVANGCLIEGKVENSVIYRNVRIGRGAVVKNSIVMPKTEIEEGAVLDRVILDKHTLVRKGTWLEGDKDRPVIIKKRSVV